MALPTWTWLPSFELSLTEDPAVDETPLGDGYTDRTPIGLRPRVRAWQLRFDTRTLVEVKAMLAFLRERNGWQAFHWTPLPPDDVPGIWIAKPWSLNQRNGVVYGISATFREQ